MGEDAVEIRLLGYDIWAVCSDLNYSQGALATCCCPYQCTIRLGNLFPKKDGRTQSNWSAVDQDYTVRMVVV